MGKMGKVISEGIETVVKNTDDIAKAVGKNSNDVAKVAKSIPNLKTNEVFNGIKDLVSPSLGDVDDNKLKQLLKTMGHTTTSNNGAVKLGFGNNATEETIYKVANSVEGLINKSGAKNIDDVIGYIQGGSKSIETMSNSLNLDSASIKSILRNKKIDPGAVSNEQIKEVVQTATSRPKPVQNGTKTPGSPIKSTPASDLKGDAPKSTPAPDAKQFKDYKRSRYESQADYMKFRAASEYEDIIKAYNKKDFNNSILKDKNIDKNTTMDQIKKMRNQAINDAPSELGGFRDWMGYNKVPQKVTGVTGTAWLVNKLASTGGQQTNSQLYGQTPY